MRGGIRPLVSNMRIPKYAATSKIMTARAPLINERMEQPHGREVLEKTGGAGGIVIVKDLESFVQNQVQTAWKNSGARGD